MRRSIDELYLPSAALEKKYLASAESDRERL